MACSSTALEVIELYEKIVSGELLRFPLGFWDGEEAYEYAAILTRHILRKTDTDPTDATKKVFTQNKLSGVLRLIGSTYGVIDNAFPGVYHPWELVQTPVGYWTDDGWENRAGRATRWMIKERLGLKPEEIPEKVDYRTFHENCLGGMINIAFNESLFAAIDNAYPCRFQLWEFRKLRLVEWTPALAAEAVRWLVLKKLRISPREAIGVINCEVVQQYNLSSAYKVVGSSIRNLIINAFPELAHRYWPVKYRALGPAGAARLRGKRRQNLVV